MPEMVQAIKKAARRRKISQTAYVELAVEELLKTDGDSYPKDERIKRHTTHRAQRSPQGVVLIRTIGDIVAAFNSPAVAKRADAGN